MGGKKVGGIVEYMLWELLQEGEFAVQTRYIIRDAKLT
jgi:hypothetical protein